MDISMVKIYVELFFWEDKSEETKSEEGSYCENLTKIKLEFEQAN